MTYLNNLSRAYNAISDKFARVPEGIPSYALCLIPIVNSVFLECKVQYLAKSMDSIHLLIPRVSFWKKANRLTCVSTLLAAIVACKVLALSPLMTVGAVSLTFLAAWKHYRSLNARLLTLVNPEIFPTLPVEVMEKIYSYLPPKDARALASTCKSAREVFINNWVSKAFIQKHFQSKLSSRMTPTEQLLRLQAFHAGKSSLLQLARLTGHTGEVRCLEITPDGSKVISGSWDSTLRVWDLTTGLCLHTLTGHTDWVSGLKLTPDGSKAISGSGDLTLRIWDLTTGRCLHTLTGHTDSVRYLALTPDGSKAISGSGDTTLRVWDLTTGRCLQTLRGHTDWVSCLDVTPDGSKAISGSIDTTLRVWNLTTGLCLHTLTGHTGWVSCLGVTPDGSKAISGSEDKTLRVWDLTTGLRLQTLTGHTRIVSCLALTPDGSKAISGSWDKILRVWDLTTGLCLHTLTGHTDMVSCLGVTPDGSKAISGSRDNTLRVWDLRTGRSMLHLPFVAPIKALKLSPDGMSALIATEYEIHHYDLTALGE